MNPIEPQTVYEAVGGLDGLLRLAGAWHTRVLRDEVVSHAFSHGYHPQHTERLAAYWAEALGGPATYSQRHGSETAVVRMHSGNGPHEEMDQRAIACFDRALEDVGLARDERLRRVLHDYFAWATTTTMARYHRSKQDVPAGLHIPRWSWHGLVATPRRAPKIRAFSADDLAGVMRCFTESVRVIAARHYSPVQVDAWAPLEPDLAAWRKRLSMDHVLVVEGTASLIAGFVRVEPSGLVDFLYVHPAYERQGIGSALLAAACLWARDSGAKRLEAHVSLAARPLFERFGFRVDREQNAETRGVTLRNLHMVRDVAGGFGDEH